MKVFTKSLSVLLLIFCVSGNLAFAANELFRSIANGNWNSTSTWEMSTNGGSLWFAATSTPTNLSSTITINNTVTVTENVTADQIILSGGSDLSIASGITLTYPGNGGSILVSGNSISGAGTFRIEGSFFLDLRPNGVFSAGLRVASGTIIATSGASPYIGRLYGPVTVDSGAILSPSMTGNVIVYALEIYGNVINNGTLTAGGGNNTNRNKYIRFKGEEFVNNGAVTVFTIILDTNTTISGAGTFTPYRIYIDSNGSVTMLSDMTFSPGNDFHFISGGTLNPNGYTLNFTSATLTLNSGSTITNSGLIRTQNTVNLNLRAGSNFNAPLNVNTGLTNATDFSSPYVGRLYGPVTVDAGATLAPTLTGNVIVYGLEIYGNVINNGTLTAGGGNNTNLNKYIIFKGGEFVNNGTVSVFTISLDTNINISGAGTFTPYRIYVGANGNATMLSDMTFSPALELHFISGGMLNPNGNTLNFTSGTLQLNNGAIIANSGLFRTQNTVNLNLRAGSNFNAPLRVSSGLTNATDYSTPYVGRLYGPVTVDTGATLAPTMTGGTIVYHLEYYGNVTNNGTLTAGGFNNTQFLKSMRFKCPVFVNNGLLSVLTVNLDTNLTLSGTGSFTTNVNILSNRNVTLTSDHQFSSAIINSGSTFTISNSRAKFTASNPILQNGSFITTNSKVEYNGTVLQTISSANINYNGLIINNPAGAILTGSFTIPDTLSFISGDLNLNGNNITFMPDAYLNETPGNLVFGNTGFLVTTRTLGAPSALNVAGFGALLTSSSSLGSTEIKRGHTVQNGLNGGTSIKRYYDITPANNTGLNASLVFKYDDSELNGKPEPSLKLFKSTNSGSSWLFMGGNVNIASNEITLNGITSFSRWSADSSGVSAAITLIMEGFYNIPTSNLNMSDTVRVYLRNSATPYAIVDSSIGIIDSLTFKSAYQFPNAPSGSYYLQLKHRNSLETWSKNPVIYFQDTTLNYDFTFAATQAFGNNEILKGTKYCIYSGDVTQNGFIDLTDVVQINNDANAFKTGYQVSDANGNSIVGLDDVLIAYNNSLNFVSKKTPLNP